MNTLFFCDGITTLNENIHHITRSSFRSSADCYRKEKAIRKRNSTSMCWSHPGISFVDRSDFAYQKETINLQNQERLLCAWQCSWL